MGFGKKKNKNEEVNTSNLDKFDDLDVIDISSDVEYQLKQERAGINVVKLEKNKTTRKFNSFDLFFVRLWAAIVSAVTFLSSGFCKLFTKIFKKEIPERYVTSVFAIILIIILIVIILAPFNLTVGEKNTVEIFSNTLIPVSKNINGKVLWGYVDRSGRQVIDFKFYDAEPFYHNVAFVMTDEYTWKLVGTNGKIKNGFEAMTIADEPGRRVVGDFNNREARAWVYKNGTYSFIKTNGEPACKGALYNYAESFSDGYALVQKSSLKWCFINARGDIKSDLFDEAKSFSEGIAAVKTSSGWTFVNTDFKEITKGGSFSRATSFHNGYAWVRVGDTVNLIDKKGRTLLPSEYVGMKPSDTDLRELGFEVGNE